MCYKKLHVQKLWGNQAPGETDQRRDDRILRNKKKAIKVLMFVVGLFAICWLPLQTYQGREIHQNFCPIKFNDFT